nr:AAA family ATPase [Rubrivivax sp.]
MSAAPKFQQAQRDRFGAADEHLVRRLEYVLADELDDADQAFDDELIEGVIGRIAMAVIYGDSNSGKTFLAIDMGAAVGAASEWMARPAAGGMVVYLVLSLALNGNSPPRSSRIE